MKKIVLSLGLIAFTVIAFAQLQSPDEFLGYKLGSHFTPHFKIVNYLYHVAQQAPAMVKIEKYGETNEGRPLLLAYVASKENFPNLEDIRRNNLRLANSSLDKMTASEDAPAIVWLSYNVHGNEASSSEAAMLTLYELVNPSNSKSKEWLKNTVVIIDPCINPDGRDRYVNWENQQQGKSPNANPVAREHNEPWPGGRTNHYNFDLNRDWAWQTQVETQQRIIKYNQWLPEVHVDFHEQGYNAPYYFAPAAEPFHEVITPWQREFQTTIGKNNAKHFDENGWLYFTKERFDLFYPSYGDTYPIYSGSIGMTFEQGGHSRGGLAVVMEDGDTLTLRDRLIHHFTTGMSTIEITSQNAAKVLKEFHKYFNTAVQTPVGEFKSYVLKYDGTDRIERLKTVLNRNAIDWAYTNVGSFTGLNYQTGKSEPFKTEAGDIVINANQPKGNLIKVLFERTSKLSDSATYDITAWSLPFVYGLKAYGMKDYVAASGKNNPLAAAAVPELNFENTYAYVAKWNGLNSAKFLAALLNNGVRVRYAEQPFKAGGSDFDKGSLLITKAANSGPGKNLETIVKNASAAAGIQVTPIPSGFVDKGFDLGSDRVRFIRPPKIALLAGNEVSSNAMGEIWHFFEQQLNYPVTLINTDDINRMVPGDFNVLIIPDGYYTLFSQKEKNEQLKDWVRKGGKIIALENAVAQMSNNDWGFKIKGSGADEKKDKDEPKKDDYTLLKKYENRERDYLVNSIPGSIFKVELDNSHPLAFGYPDSYYTLKQDDNIYEFLKDGWNVGVIRKDNYVSGFTGSKLKEKLKDGTLFGVMDMGRGVVVFLADNPMFRSFWENGKLLFCNAVFLVGQ
jgi:Zinc carboxypeptidase